MATQAYRIVSGDDSALHDEPHIEGRRVTVQFVHERVENGGLDPQTVADRHDLALADVYRALAYYHDHPAEMQRVEQRRRQATEEHRHLTTDPDDVRG